MTFKTALPLVLAVSVFALAPCPVFAQNTTRPGLVPPRPAQAELMRDEAASNAGQMRAQGEQMRDDAASKAGEMRIMVASGSAKLKERLATFRNKKKAETIERISNAITSINQRRTSQLMTHVDRLNTVLGKAEDRVVAVETAGQDLTDAKTELGLAKTALANAKTAVEEQSKKFYEIEIASESGARADVKETRDLFHQDITATHNLVREARRVLINAIIKLGQAMGEPVNVTN